MPLFTRADLRTTWVVSMRFLGALSGAISRVSVQIFMTHLLPYDHVIQPHLCHLLDLIDSLTSLSQ